MKVYLDCLPCFLRQALEAVRQVDDDERKQRVVVNRVAAAIPGFAFDATPIDLARDVYRIVRESTGIEDPYRKVKQSENDRLMALLPQLREEIELSSDPMFTALKLAAAGNAIDFGVHSASDLRRAIGKGLEDGEGMVDYPLLRERLERDGDILYLGDNAGEIVMDKLVVEQLVNLGKRVTFVVRGRPIINDVTAKDATYVGMDDVAEVISSGSDGPGTALRLCHPTFVETFRQAGLIVSKGQGNFEALSEERAPLFFLLKVKCPIVARELGAKIGKCILRAQRGGAEFG